jgi:hypothetical protein
MECSKRMIPPGRMAGKCIAAVKLVAELAVEAL